MTDNKTDKEKISPEGCSGRVLIFATTAYMIERFNMMNISLLQDMGYTVDVACNFEFGNPMSTESIEDFKVRLKAIGVDAIQLPVNRRIYDLKNNGAAFIKTLKLMRGRKYRFVHCHTPVGSVVARLAAKFTATKVIYTAHGFHFFEGAPRINWMLYYPAEKLFSYITDVLITINREDYGRAHAKFGMKRLEYVPGIGIDTGKYTQCRDEKIRSAIRKELGIDDDVMLILMVGELSKRKNHISVLKAVAELTEKDGQRCVRESVVSKVKTKNYTKSEGKSKSETKFEENEHDLKSESGSEFELSCKDDTDSLYPSELLLQKNEQETDDTRRRICICIAGTGIYQDYFEQYIQEKHLQDSIKLLGYREDTIKLYTAADAFLFPSYQEGLSAALMEAMACGLPVAASRIRGNTDLVDEAGGMLFDVGREPKHINDESRSVQEITKALVWLKGLSEYERKAMGAHNQDKIREHFDTATVRKRLHEIYSAAG